MFDNTSTGKVDFDNLIPESDNVDDFLKCDEIVDWHAPEIETLARSLTASAASDVEKAKRLYEWVRDEIPHSCDACHEIVTCRASDVLRYRTGICIAKSHLLAALLRAEGIQAGFCYQLLRYGDESSARSIVHGFNAVYLKSLERWFRVDPRGNKPGADAQFRLDGERLAFPVNRELGEFIHPTIFVNPLPSVVQSFARSATVSELLQNLPDSIEARSPEETNSTIVGIRKGLDSMERGEGIPDEAAFEQLREKYKIPRGE